MPYLIVQVVFDTPLDFFFDYRYRMGGADEARPQAGQLALVPFGKRTDVGLIISVKETSDVEEEKLKEVISIIKEIPPFRKDWIDFCRFAARYYQRTLGEVVLSSLPSRVRKNRIALRKKSPASEKKEPDIQEGKNPPVLNEAQAHAVDAIAGSGGFVPYVLFGVTGSGKTEVYLHAVSRTLAKSPDTQVLILVPEINLTPQLEKAVRNRFPGETVVSLHSRLTETERLRNWLDVLHGRARIILGTRMAVLAPAPALGLIIVDEEHDPSYKQQEGLRYSARDLAVWRANQQGIPVVLGSATPSLESWQHVQTGRYRRLELPERAVKDAVLPEIKLVDISRATLTWGLSETLVRAVRSRLEKHEQVLLFLNRRGYAPVLMCDACGWISACSRCSAYMVFHKVRRLLRCHHCGLELRVPRVCPDCGNADLKALGFGTQKIEEGIGQVFPDARILRVDADSTSRKGSLEEVFRQIHEGEADIIVGTQMLAKGHDFRNITLVGVLNPDNALFSHDYRAGERLFSLLMQVAGRAGRTSSKDGKSPGEVLIQTRYPSHPLYRAALLHQYEQYAAQLLKERLEAHLPPFGYQALLAAESSNIEKTLDFLRQAADLIPPDDAVIVNDPVPMAVMRVADSERAQLLVESQSRVRLQQVLANWLSDIRRLKTGVKWHIEVDPMSI